MTIENKGLEKDAQKVDEHIAIHFRDQFRQGRAVALRDAEAFHEIIFTLERFGAFLYRKVSNLGQYKEKITEQACPSPMACEIPRELPEFHTPFSSLYQLVRDARNSALHEGAYARHLTTHAVELSLVLEDALMNGYDQVRHFMVRNPVCAYPWQPLSFIRQTMLVNSFSYLPVLLTENDKTNWWLISDLLLARYLRCPSDQTTLKQRLMQTLDDVIKTKGIELHQPYICNPSDSISAVLEKSNGFPILVESKETSQLLGILTSFDVL